MNRNRIERVVGEITEHYGLNRHLKKLISGWPSCVFCGLEEETSIHMICECPKFLQLRRGLVGDWLYGGIFSRRRRHAQKYSWFLVLLQLSGLAVSVFPIDRVKDLAFAISSFSSCVKPDRCYCCRIWPAQLFFGLPLFRTWGYPLIKLFLPHRLHLENGFQSFLSFCRRWPL